MPRLTEDMKKFIKENSKLSNRKLEEAMSSNGKLGPSRTAIGNYKNSLKEETIPVKVVKDVVKVVKEKSTPKPRVRRATKSVVEDKQFMTSMFARFFAQRSTKQEDMVKALGLVDKYFV